MMTKMGTVWQRVWRLWTNEDGGAWRQDWKWKGWIFWHISLLKHKHISRVSWNTNAPKEYFDSHPSSLERPENAKGFGPKANLWPDFRIPRQRQRLPIHWKVLGAHFWKFESEGMAVRIRGWCVGSNIYGQIADRILRARYSLTANVCSVQCAVCSAVNKAITPILHIWGTAHMVLQICYYTLCTTHSVLHTW